MTEEAGGGGGDEFLAQVRQTPWQAALFSVMLGGGTGQICLGQMRKGRALIGGFFGLMVVNCAVLEIVPIFEFLLFPLLVVYLCVCGWDAWSLGKRTRNGQTLGEWEWFWDAPKPPQLPPPTAPST